jgi:hypothetical protein
MYVELERIDGLSRIPFDERRQVIHPSSRTTLHRGHVSHKLQGSFARVSSHVCGQDRRSGSQMRADDQVDQ